MDIIVDIDGTIANCSHRLHHIKNKPKNWKAFFDGMVEDKPILPMINVIRSLYSTGNRLIFITGRPDSYREVTESWLVNYLFHDVKFNEQHKLNLFMRKSKDHREDTIVKAELLNIAKQQGFEPVLAFEDRPRIVDMWREHGLICLAVNSNEF